MILVLDCTGLRLNRVEARVDMTPIATIQHQMPGRLRLRIPARRGDASFFHGVVQALSKVPGIEELDAFPLTGSIIIRHSGSAQAIAAAALEQGLFEVGLEDPQKKAATPQRPYPGVRHTATTGLNGLALLQLARGQLTGNAAENFWNAYGAQRILGRPEIAAGFVLLGIVQVLRGQLLGSASSLFFYSLITRQLASVDRGATASNDSGVTPTGQPGDQQTG
jgi:Heavy metal associated domain 2